jgi:alanine dehydrogenase
MPANARVRAISDELVGSVITLVEVIELIEGAFAADADGEHRNFPVVRERLAPAHNGIFGIKSGIAGRTLGFKAGGFWPDNRARGVLPHQSTMVLFDPDTGQPISLIGANRITGLRTGAAGAVAARHLARASSRSAAILGCGAQGRMQLRALAQVLRLDRVSVWDKFPEAATAFAAELGNELGVQIGAAADAECAVRGVDLIVTATPGEGPVLQNDWVEPGQHINAIGADTAGKQELETEILLRSSLFVDNRQQALTLGESQHLGKKVDNPDARICAELGEVILGTKLGRQRDDEITVFDATGVTFQDLVVAGEIFRRCQERGLGTVVPM